MSLLLIYSAAAPCLEVAAGLCPRMVPVGCLVFGQWESEEGKAGLSAAGLHGDPRLCFALRSLGTSRSVTSYNRSMG